MNITPLSKAMKRKCRRRYLRLLELKKSQEKKQTYIEQCISFYSVEVITS